MKKDRKMGCRRAVAARGWELGWFHGCFRWVFPVNLLKFDREPLGNQLNGWFWWFLNHFQVIRERPETIGSDPELWEPRHQIAWREIIVKEPSFQETFSDQYLESLMEERASSSMALHLLLSTRVQTMNFKGCGSDKLLRDFPVKKSPIGQHPQQQYSFLLFRCCNTTLLFSILFRGEITSHHKSPSNDFSRACYWVRV